MNKLAKNTLAIFLLPLLLQSSCKKERKENATPQTMVNNGTQTGTLMFHLHTFVGADEVDAYNIQYTMESGRALSLSIAQFYLSDIQIEKLDGTLYDLSDKKVLKILESETYVVGSVPVGNYKSIRFKVGLPSSTNSKNPGSSADSTILKHSEMWFSNIPQPGGYVFFNIKGTIDTTSDMSGAMLPFVYKIGTDANYKQVIMPAQNHTVLYNQVEYIHMYVDCGRLFNGVTLDRTHLQINTTADNNTALATQIVNNIPSMFKYE